MRNLRYTLTVCVLLMSLISTACGGGAPTPAPQAPSNTAVNQPPASTAPPASAPTQPTVEPAATATLDPTRKALDLSRSNQPGSTIAGSVVEQIVFGEGYDDKKNEIVSPAFIFPVAIPKVLFAFGVANGTQSLTFTETLKFNGEVIPLPVTKFSVPPSGVGQKQLRVKGLAVKAGAQFPIGRYQIEAYSEGKLVQQGIFDVQESKSTGLWFNDSAPQLLVAWPSAGRTQADPNIFIVTEEEIVVVPDETDYYEAEELQAAYQQLEHADELFEPFPDDVMEAIEEDAALEAEASCAAAGGVFESASGQCFVDDDPEEACQAIGGIYDPATDNCSFGDDDSDDDSWLDSLDNCPFIGNADQNDADHDDVGDACDSDSGGSGGDDSDGDGWADNLDNCPFIANADQSDADHDDVGDACDSDSGGTGGGNDSDGDGVADDQDNCLNDANPGQEDADSDGVGDVCDSDSGGGNDSDGDGVADDQDNCPNDANPGQEDSDSDGIGDVCDTSLALRLAPLWMSRDVARERHLAYPPSTHWLSRKSRGVF